jgi:hypothetical protein
MPAAPSASPEVVAGWLSSVAPGAVPVAVLDERGTVLAGDPAVGARAIRALRDAPGIRAVTARSTSAVLVVARDGGFVVAIEVPPRGLAGLARADLAVALDLLAGG